MKKALVIGAAGFVGRYLIDEIYKSSGWNVAATKMKQESFGCAGADVHDLDILDLDAVTQLLRELRPDYIFHLAAQSSVARSWKDPDLTVDVNIKGSLHVLESIRVLDHRPRVLLVGSCEEYGHVRPEEVPVSEGTALRPGNPYAVTKACQNMVGKIYADAYGMDIVSVRSFNHMGPDQAPLFVVADFCRQVAEIEAGLCEPVLRVGNLSARRDFTDVRDVVRAYVLLMRYGKAGETYNVGSGEAVPVSDILKKIISMSTAEIRVETDPAKFRPADVPVLEADVSKLRTCCGWERRISLETTLRDTLEYWRAVCSRKESGSKS